MSNLDDPTSTDITDLILVEHAEFRARFANLWDMRGDRATTPATVAWRMLSYLLEVHAKAEEEILYPVLLKRGSDQASAETLDAIGDHNQIRDAIKLASEATTGTEPWWAAVLSCRKANDEHLAEEERDVIPDVRTHTDPDLRSELGGRWTTFHAEHRAARGLSEDDVDPKDYVRDNS
jgi:iron-sulfur cluster repair protein YtfE (RIC family)